MRAVVLGGTGAIGGATALRLAESGWAVDVTGRGAGAMPPELAAAGVRFHQVERSDVSDIGQLVGDGVELLVDLLAYKASHVRALLPVMSSVGCPVLISTRAVYVDPSGQHINGDEPPRFPVPIPETNPTLQPANDDVNPYTREGYAPSKVAAEVAALDSGLPVTIIRPSKVQGRWARNARTESFVEAMLRGEASIKLAEAGPIDHLTAAANTAALIETVAGQPGQRVLNSADPDAPSAEQIVRAIGERLEWSGGLKLLDSSHRDSSRLATLHQSEPHPDEGNHPWMQRHPVVLDTTASARLGYEPVGTALELLAGEIDWVAERVRRLSRG